jgi:luciferase family oxidoreductase group 1
VPSSVPDLPPTVTGLDAADAPHRSIDLARHAERWGYCRFWLTGHHNAEGLACSATMVLIAHMAGHTLIIRVGTGGIVRPNHAPPLVEQFGTLAALFPRRRDLGLGRASGTNPAAARALRHNLNAGHKGCFADDVLELQAYFDGARPDQMVCAVPGTSTRVPIWILRSRLWDAQFFPCPHGHGRRRYRASMW